MEAARYRPAFRHLALLIQVPGVDIEERVAAEKGAPLDEEERRILDERVRLARAWLDTFAPDRYRVEVQAELPAGCARRLTEAQRVFLRSLAAGAEREQPNSGDAWQDLIFRTAQEHGVPSGDAFAALYAAFLGRANGPRAGWLLASLERAFVVERLAAARQRRQTAAAAGMSVGLQRLREDAATIRQGAIDKGEDPQAWSTRRSRSTNNGASCSARRTGCAPSATRPASRSVPPSAAARTPTRVPEVAGAAGAVDRDRHADRPSWRGQLARAQAELDDLLLRIPNPPDPASPSAARRPA